MRIFRYVIPVSIFYFRFQLIFSLVPKSVIVTWGTFFLLASNIRCYRFIPLNFGSLYRNGVAWTRKENGWLIIAFLVLLKKGWFSYVRIDLKERYHVDIAKSLCKSFKENKRKAVQWRNCKLAWCKRMKLNIPSKHF